MRLWSLHPKYLDRQGLLAVWREGLLAQAVLGGQTEGYARHPQLERFRAQPDPMAAIRAYLRAIAEEGGRRGYGFDTDKITPGPEAAPGSVKVTYGQMIFERDHLRAKLILRAPYVSRRLTLRKTPEAHPLFKVIKGDVEPWERAYNEKKRARR